MYTCSSQLGYTCAGEGGHGVCEILTTFAYHKAYASLGLLQLHGWTGNAETQLHLRADRDKLKARTEPIGERSIELVLPVVAHRLAQQTGADCNPYIAHVA